MGSEVLLVSQPHVSLKEHSYLDKKHRNRAKATGVNDYQAESGEVQAGDWEKVLH